MQGLNVYAAAMRAAAAGIPTVMVVEDDELVVATLDFPERNDLVRAHHRDGRTRAAFGIGFAVSVRSGAWS